MKKLKVFHGLVNYGTQAGLFAQELRNQGVNAISVVNADAFKRKSDIELMHGGSLILRIWKYSWNYIRKIYWFFSFNTFHFYFGTTLLPKQRDLPFYRIFRKKVLMEYLGNDIRNYKLLVKRYCLSEHHKFYKHMNEHDEKVSKRISNERKFLNYKVACLPNHIELAKEYNYQIDEILPLAIDLKKIKFSPLVLEDKIKILHAPTNKEFKGTKLIEEAINKLIEEGFMINFKIIQGITFNELYKEYEACNIFIDQISVGWYGTAALEAMAFGRPTCAFIDERYFKYIDYKDEIPVININEKNIIPTLRSLLNKKEDLPQIGIKSRIFVEKHHDVIKITKKLISIYQDKLWN